MTTIFCPGSQNDVSVWGNLLFVSVESPRRAVRTALGAGGRADPPEKRFRGIRIFDISNIQAPQPGRRRADLPWLAHAHARASEGRPEQRLHLRLGHVQACVPRRSSPAATRAPTRPLAIRPSGASTSSRSRSRTRPRRGRRQPAPVQERGDRRGQRPAERPDDRRSTRARSRRRPPPAAPGTNPATGGNWSPSPNTNQCHDITVYEEIDLAAGACAGNGLLIDISDPANPKRIDAVADPLFAYWHGATFSNDGKAVLFTDEWGGGYGARCRATDQLSWGADAIYEIVNKKLVFRSYYKLPVAQTVRRELRLARRQPDPDPRQEHHDPGLVPGWRFARRLDRPGEPEGDRLLRPRSGQHDAVPVVRRLLVDVLVQRPHLRHGDRARLRHVQAHADGRRPDGGRDRHRRACRDQARARRTPQSQDSVHVTPSRPPVSAPSAAPCRRRCRSPSARRRPSAVHAGRRRTYEASTTANGHLDGRRRHAERAGPGPAHRATWSTVRSRCRSRCRPALATRPTPARRSTTSGRACNLLTYSGPISNDQVALQFSQAIGANDALRTGTYSKTLTFTLSTTNP